MKVALVQIPLVWENVAENMTRITAILNNIEEDTDLVVLPEMFTSGFTMKPSMVSIQMSDPFISVLKSLSTRYSYAITGSIVIEEGTKFFNRLFFITPDDNIRTYDKRHLFSLAGEEKVYEAGEDRLVLAYKGWNICPLVCYDLRFPVFSRNADSAYDLLLYVASWPDQRIYAWDSLLKARAIENMSYVVGVNRCGEDENDNVYSGHSQVLDSFGKYIVDPQKGEVVRYAVLDKEIQDRARKRFNFLADADVFHLM